MTISIAMATYKGARYIEEQLQSIFDQSLKPDEIVICDDGSPDETVALIRKIAASSAIPIHVYPNETNLGVIKNFQKAISLCKSEYIALADQDDVWLPEKLAQSMAVLTKLEYQSGKDKPLLVHTDLQVVDKNLTMIHPSMFAYSRLPLGGLSTLLFDNYVTGCTTVFNQALQQAALPFPDDILMHDHWLGMVAAGLGDVVTLPIATMLYRQHGANQVGASDSAKAGSMWKNFLSLRHIGRVAKELCQGKRFTYLKAIGQQIHHLDGRMQHANAVADKKALVRQADEAFSAGGLEKLTEVIRKGIWPPTLKGKLIFMVYILLFAGRQHSR